MEIAYLIGGLIIGAVIAWLFVKQKSAGTIATLENELQNSNAKQIELSTNLDVLKNDLSSLVSEKNIVDRKIIETEVKIEGTERELSSTIQKLKTTQDDLDTKTKEFNVTNSELATTKASVTSLTEKLDTQKEEMKKLNEQFSKEFENIANRILEEKTEKFTTTNKTNIELLLKPLGENLDRFKAKVEEVYDKESKERFSLGEKVKELAVLNQIISEEAKNLTKALKGESKTQGLWGEMILESILEKSGLVKDREYFMEH